MRRPERVVRVVVVVGGGESGFLARGWGVEEAGGVRERGHPDVPVSSTVMVESRCAGLSRSVEMVSSRPFFLMVKYLSVRLMIGYGPS